MIYLDAAASTKVSDNVRQILNKSLDVYGNPSSIHNAGISAKQLIINATNKIKKKINANNDDELIFTSGATMSNNLFIQGFLQKYPDAHFVTSTIEHNDIMLLAKHLEKEHSVHYVGVHNNGLINLTELDYILAALSMNKKPILCSIQWANGECGTIQNMAKISQIVHKYPNVILHTDLTQYIPFYDVDVQNIGIDAFSMSGQKIHCIKGTGLLYIKENVEIDPMIFGEQGILGGTENVPGITCLGQAFEDLNWDNDEIIKEKRDKLFNGIQDIGFLLGNKIDRIPNNIYMHIPKFDSESFVILLNEFGVCASAGSACSNNGINISHVVLAMGYGEDVAKHCIRFTLPDDITDEEINEAIRIIREIFEF